MERSSIKLLFTSLLLLVAACTFGHGVQLRWHITNTTGDIRVWIEHWHGDVNNVSGYPLVVSYTVNGVTTQQTYYATGWANNTTVANLPAGGNTSTLLSSCSGDANSYNDWVYWDFSPPACNTPVTMTIVEGTAATTTEGCSNLYPQTFTSNFTDVTGPVMVCNDVNVSVDNPTACTATVASYGVTSTDACGGTTTETFSIAEGSTFSLGYTSITATSTDPSNNSSTCSFNVIVADNLAPIVQTNNISVNLTNGSASITAAQIDNNTVDCGGIATRSLSQSSFSCSDVGNKTVTLSITDNNGNTGTATATITVIESQAPIANCKNHTVNLDANGQASVSGLQLNNNSSDHCGIASLTPNPSSFTGADVGTNNVTLTVTDNNGNSSTCTSIVTVDDVTDPTVTGKNATIQLDANGQATLNASAVFDAGNSSDNSGTVTATSVSPSSFDCSHVGSNQTVTVTGSDPSGNTATATATVTVQDVTDPNAICQDVTIYLGSNGQAIINGTDIDNGSNDACGIASLSPSPNSFGANELGTNNVTLTVTDNNGNSANCTSTVTVVDNTPPSVVSLNTTLTLDNSGQATLNAAAVFDAVNSSDNSGTVSVLGVSPSAFDCSHTGQAQTVTVTGVDGSGNTATATAQVTVQDNTAPTAVCQTTTVNLNGNGQATLTGSQINNGSSDVCGIASLAASPNSFNANQVGSNAVILTVTDNNGNTDTCNVNITVADNTPPVVVGKTATIQLDATGNIILDPALVFDATNSSDNSGTVNVVSVSPNAFDCTHVGQAQTVTVTGTDPSGNTATATTTVTIQDDIIPTAICQTANVPLDANGNGSLSGSDIDNGSNDACGIASLIASPSSFTSAALGTNNVTLTVTDNHGNSASCNTTINLVDNIAPTVVGKTATIQLDANGNATLDPALVFDANNSTDNSGPVTVVSVSPNTFDCSHTSQAQTVTVTGTDSSGNTSTATTTVTIQDIINPTASCQTTTITLDNNGQATLSGAQIDGGSADECSIVSRVAIPSSFNANQVGSNPATLIVFDPSGGSASCNVNVTVTDGTPPTVVGKTATIQLDVNGNATLDPSLVFDATNSSDNSGSVSVVSVSPNTFDCTHTGQAQTVTVTGTDPSGNTATATTTVTIQDVTNPAAQCQTTNVFLDANGNASITGSDINNGSSDACGIASLSANPNSFTAANLGSNAVTLTVTDNNGNTSTCNTTISLIDNVPPVVVGKAATLSLDANGTGILDPSAVFDAGSSSDNSGTVSVQSVAPNSFDCSHIGTPQTVTVTGIDGSGNIATATTSVMIVDTTPPVATCQDVTVLLDASGVGTVDPNSIDNGSTDACGIASFVASPNTLIPANLGTNTITLIVTDNYGNFHTCTSNVTLEDNIPPTVVGKTATIELDANGNVTLDPADVFDQNNSSDNSGSVSVVSVSPANFDCSAIGQPQTVTVTGTDGSGNTATATTTVTVEDNIAPQPVCQTFAVQLDGSGNGVLNPSDVYNASSSYDNCGNINLLSVSTTSFDCSDVGASHNVTLLVGDGNGNVKTCTTTITVEDNNGPTAACQNATVSLNPSGQATLNADDVFDEANSSDNCSGSSGLSAVSVSPNSFDCSDIGSGNVVTLTVQDMDGNLSTCNASVTVEETNAPTVICQNISINLDAANQASITPGDVFDATSSDDCGGVSPVSISLSNFDCAHIGANNVTLTAEDDNGNSSTCTAIVTVGETEPPVVVCKDVSVELNSQGQYELDPAELLDLAQSSDNCGTVNAASVSLSAFDCQQNGSNSVTLTANDGHGNTGSCTSTVTVGPFLEIIHITASDETCVGLSDGLISMLATAPAGEIRYSIDNGQNYQLLGLFENLTPDTYNIKIKVFNIDGICEHIDARTVVVGSPQQTWYQDMDDDGYSNGMTEVSCFQPTGSKLLQDLIAPPVGNDVDCNDSNEEEYPGQVWYKDSDEDGCGDGTFMIGCSPPAEYYAPSELDDLDADCNDNDAGMLPGNVEICDGMDNDCDGLIDEGVSTTYVGHVVFTSQTEVDAWAACYTIIDGDVTIMGSNITDLSPLLNITEINGNLTIISNAALTSLNGLDNLATVDGILYMYYNFQLLDCCAIDDLLENNGISGAKIIFFNKPGSHCNSEADIKAACPLNLYVAPTNDDIDATTTGVQVDEHKKPAGNQLGAEPLEEKPLSEETGSLAQPNDLHQQPWNRRIVLFPNPAKDAVTILLDHPVPGAQLVIKDVLGQTILQQNMDSESNRLHIDFTGHPLENGMYFVSVVEEDQITTKQLIIQQ